ncbi:MAG: M15 family metallopeptidase [Chthoniobacterales bacterium]
MSNIFIRTFFLAGLLASGIRSAFPAAPDADLVPIRKVDRTILVDLRYGSSRNITGHPLYPRGMPAMLRPHVAAKLLVAQAFLREHKMGLKIWDAYRPKSAHEQLWQYSSRNPDYVADPSAGGSLHTCGVAVDATLVDEKGRDVPMPTDFDDFTDAAMLQYNGDDPVVRRNLHLLQGAMARAGFYGLRTEWWHFVSRDWKDYQPIPEIVMGPWGLPRVGQPKPAAGPIAPARALPVDDPAGSPIPGHENSEARRRSAER